MTVAPQKTSKAPQTSSEIREAFLRFFESHGHRRVASASLIPDSDPTLLFTNAGMVPFKRTFLGEETRDYVRAVSSQKCMRVSGKHNDLENVGRTPRHHTFFEMLGNFSFGDYFKEDAIRYAWEFLTQILQIASERMVVSVFHEDDEAYAIWRDQIGLPEKKIFRLGESENFWAMGDTGPCGPCSEIHMDFGKQARCAQDDCDPSCDCGRFLEIWNLVFMQYNRDASGQMVRLPKPSIDTGAGLERISAVLQGVKSNFDTDLFRKIIACAEELSQTRKGEDAEKDVSLNVVADHARSVTFLIGDGVLPSNEGRGYVLRRILRRAARHGVLLGLNEPFLYRVAETVIDEMSPAYPELSERRAYITDRIRREEERFSETLSKGLAILEAEIARLHGQAVLPGDVVFKLYDTYGFPLDLTEDILRSHALRVDLAGFEAAMEEQRARARAAWKGSGDASIDEVYGRLAAEIKTTFHGYETLELVSSVKAILTKEGLVHSASVGDQVELFFADTPFYAESGGQVGDVGALTTAGGARVRITNTKKPVEGLVSHIGVVEAGILRIDEDATLGVDRALRAATVRNHSGTHLLHAALRRVLGPQAMQRGSLVGPERLRFDFTHDQALSDEELERIEDLVNSWIVANDARSVREMTYSEAIESGAIAIFEEKYGDRVRVVRFGEVSTELCGGTHAQTTGEIGFCKIVSESGIAAGVRRIEAMTGAGAVAHVRAQERVLSEAAGLLKVSQHEIVSRIDKLLKERRGAQKEIETLRRSGGAGVRDLSTQAKEIAGISVLATRAPGADAKALRDLVDEYRQRIKTGIVLLATESDGKVAIALGVTPDLKGRYHAGDLIREIAEIVGGKGGGRPDFAQAGGSDASKIDAAIEKLYDLVTAAAQAR